ncbi:uncharacterized protein (TIGR02679 family) [Exiguobacterium sp. PvP048]|uniref:TIGR02679 family protein n=1 Tax=unclassified Exiguobacterium TaxID=2644629 RepID=UPI00339502C5
MSNRAEEAVNYFTQYPVYEKLFQLFRKKYESLGKVSGTVKIEQFTKEELNHLSGFLKRSVHHLQENPTVSLRLFERRLQETRFQVADLHELLELYFQEPILWKQQLRMDEQELRRQKFEQRKIRYPQLSDWLSLLEAKNEKHRWILKQLDENETILKTLHLAITEKPSDLERISVYAQRIAGDPHAFDGSTVLGRCLIHYLYHLSNQQEGYPTSSEAINALLLTFGVLRDDISNFISIANIQATYNGGIHPVFAAASQQQSVLNVPLREILRLDGCHLSRGKDVFVVENSGVFSAILDDVPTMNLICTHGQIRIAGWKMLDLLALAGCRIHYSGDFDPEGLQMAQRILERYPKQAVLWRMSPGDYALSSPSVRLNQERLSKLNSIRHVQLVDLAKHIKDKKVAGYQEGLLTHLIKDSEQYNECQE